MLLRFLPLARPLGELAEPKVAPGHEWAHPELRGDLHCLLDMRPARLGVRVITPCLGLAEDQETGRFVAALAAIAQSAGGS